MPPDGHQAGELGSDLCANDVVAVCADIDGELRAGRLLDAQLRCQRALEASPEQPELLHLMALICLGAAEFDHAVEWVSRAIRKDPKPSHLATLGTALQRAGRLDDAAKTFDKAIQLKPDDAALWASLGGVLRERNQPSDALLCFEHAQKLDPHHIDAAYQSAAVLLQLGRLEEALAQCDLCETLRPHDAATISMRSVVLRSLKRFEDSLADARRAQSFDPGNAVLCGNIAAALVLLNRHEEALEWFEQALSLQPLSVPILEGKAIVLRQLHRFDEVFALYDRILSIDPANARIAFSVAIDHLLLGNFEAGWRGRESPWRNPPNFCADGHAPLWLGEHSIAGQTILIHADEGLGDSIQFTRYVPMLAARGARVVLVVQDSLHALLSTLPGLR